MATTKTVTIANLAYDPSPITVEEGDSVQWINKDAGTHTATRTESPEFDTGSLRRDEVSSPIVFDQISGEDGFEYHCTPHPFMRGFIIVIPQAEPKLDCD